MKNYIKYFNNNLTKSFIDTKDINYKKDISNFLFNYFRETGFPFHNYSEHELRTDWKNLLSFNSSVIEHDKIISNYKSFGTKIFKHFTPHIYETKTKSKPSMIEAFNDDTLLKACIDNRLGITYKETFNITPAMLFQGFKNANVSSHVSIFKPVIAKFIYDKFTKSNDIVYDFSLGFGQRFIGAMSVDKNLFYIGCDPWEKNINTINNIANFIGSQNLYVENIGSEYFCPKKYINKVGLAFSSPPYFNTEIYDNNNESQAYHNGYAEYLKWFEKTIENIITLLKPNGVLAINIPENIFQDIKTHLSDMDLLDIYYIQLSRNNVFSKHKKEPIYILKKKAYKYNEIQNETTQEIIKRYLKGESSESIAKDLNINGSTVCRKLKKHNVEIRPASQNKRKYNLKENWLKNIDSQQKAYFLGLMITDGTVHHKRDEATIGLSETDIDVLKQISNIVYGEEIIHLYDVIGSSTRCAKLGFYGKTFKDNLILNGCPPQKTFLTEYSATIPDHLHSHFIRGLYDGDGCIYIGKNRVVVDLVGTEMLCDGIIHVINNLYNLNIKFSKYKGKKHKGTICSMRINKKQDVIKFLDFIYNDAIIYIKRKYNKYNLIKTTVL